MIPRDPITFFISGTDSGVGKTLVAAALLQAARERGLGTLGMKPLATGCDETAQGLCSQDVLLLRKHSSIDVPYAMSNPISLRLAVEPHLAALQEGRRLDAGRLEGYCRAVLMQRAGLTLIGRARGKRFVVLSGADRLIHDQDLAYVPEESAKHRRKGAGGED